MLTLSSATEAGETSLESLSLGIFPTLKPDQMGSATFTVKVFSIWGFFNFYFWMSISLVFKVKVSVKVESALVEIVLHMVTRAE